MQTGPIIEHIWNDNLLDLFMGFLKEIIWNEVGLFEPDSIEHAFSLSRKVESKNMATRKLVSNNYREHHAPSLRSTSLKPQQMDERRKKGLYFNYDVDTVRGINVMRINYYT